MNKYELRAIITVCILMAGFIFALLFSVFGQQIDVPACVPYSGGYTKPHVKVLDGLTWEIYGVAHMWAFEPQDITVPAGITVNFYLTSSDVVHGFDIVNKGVNLMAVPGAVAKTSITFDRAGVYQIVCHEYCGVGHQNMMGKITVR
ncbi:MAG TPA: hypothetical protein VGI43_02515 [Mucilaginibacter sp.]|jgi:cytochrome c oxidase subunit 2